MLQTTQVVQTCLEFTKRAGFENTCKDFWDRLKGRASSQLPTIDKCFSNKRW